MVLGAAQVFSCRCKGGGCTGMAGGAGATGMVSMPRFVRHRIGNLVAGSHCCQ
jgi:hypothetical protein